MGLRGGYPSARLTCRNKGQYLRNSCAFCTAMDSIATQVLHSQIPRSASALTSARSTGIRDRSRRQLGLAGMSSLPQTHTGSARKHGILRADIKTRALALTSLPTSRGKVVPVLTTGMWPAGNIAGPVSSTASTPTQETRMSLPGPRDYPISFLEILDSAFGSANWKAGTAEWATPAGRLFAAFKRLDARTATGQRVTGAVTVTLQLRPTSAQWTEVIITRHRTIPGMGAAYIASAPAAHVEVISRVCLLEDEQEDHETLGVHLAAAAISHMVASAVNPSEVAAAVLSQKEDPSAWSEAEFLDLTKMMMHHEMDARLDDSGLVVALSDGEVPARLADPSSSRLGLSASCRHPALGRGLAAELSIPLIATPARAFDIARQLNDLELRWIVGSPLFGSWILDPNGGRLLHASFWPNLAHVPNLLPRIATWQAERLALATHALKFITRRRARVA
jgi:hypothetical protein